MLKSKREVQDLKSMFDGCKSSSSTCVYMTFGLIWDVTNFMCVVCHLTFAFGLRSEMYYRIVTLFHLHS